MDADNSVVTVEWRGGWVKVEEGVWGEMRWK